MIFLRSYLVDNSHRLIGRLVILDGNCLGCMQNIKWDPKINPLYKQWNMEVAASFCGDAFHSCLRICGYNKRTLSFFIHWLTRGWFQLYATLFRFIFTQKKIEMHPDLQFPTLHYFVLVHHIPSQQQNTDIWLNVRKFKQDAVTFFFLPCCIVSWICSYFSDGNKEKLAQIFKVLYNSESSVIHCIPLGVLCPLFASSTGRPYFCVQLSWRHFSFLFF